MAIQEKEIRQMGAGHSKSIDEAALPMMMDVLQAYQYSYPIQSTIRELVSNGIDSVREKKMAIELLTGRAKPEDYFVHREGAEYKNSGWKPEYYNLAHLQSKDEVEIRYIVGGNTKKDRIIITDTGVGLGGERLEGYFRLGYSTKRLSKLPLGKFGIGAKSPLSVGVDFYTIESVYNGQLFRFNIYAHTFDSIIPKLNLQTGELNSSIVFNKGSEHEYVVYYEKTDRFNGLSISIDAKKHHKQQYIEAVKQQLLYFDNLKLCVEEDGKIIEVPYKAEVLYEDDYIVLSDNNYYSKPHILLNRVSYGYINWLELELEDRHGNIGIKVSPEDVSVTPSRETVIWNERTKERVIARFNDVQHIAENIIAKELKDDDIISWMLKCKSINIYREDNSILSRLSKIVNLKEIDFKFHLNPRLNIKDDFEKNFIIKYVDISQRKSNSTGEVSKYISRKNDWTLLRSNTLIFLRMRGSKTSNLRDKYIMKTMSTQFIMVYEPLDLFELKDTASEEDYKWIADRRSNAKEDSVHPSEIWEYLVKSKHTIDYDSVIVPEDFNASDDEEDDEEREERIKRKSTKKTKDEEKEEKEAKQSVTERRKNEGKILINTPQLSNGYFRSIKDSPVRLEYINWDFRLELDTKLVEEWKEDEVYYSTNNYKQEATIAALITRDRAAEVLISGDNPVLSTQRSYAISANEWEKSKYYRTNISKAILESASTTDTPFSKAATVHGVDYFTANIGSAFCAHNFFDCKVRIIQTAENNTKYFKDFKHISKFFIDLQGNFLTMSNTLIKWNTARIIGMALHRLAFFNNFQDFNQDLVDIYNRISAYYFTHNRELSLLFKDTTPIHDLIKHLDTVQEFQNSVASGKYDSETIATLAKEHFGNNRITNAQSVEADVIAKLNILLDYASIVGTLLNSIPALTDQKTSKPSNDLEKEIKSYLELKGVLNYEITKVPSPTLDLPDGTLDNREEETTSISDLEG